MSLVCKPGFALRLFGIVVLLFSSLSKANETPQLIDLQLSGSISAPFFEPGNLTFTLGQEYVLVITNDNAYQVTFHFDKFGQAIFTRFLQGSPGVTQESLELPSSSKVLWHFIPSTIGNFSYYASNNGLNQKGKEGKIDIISPEKDPEGSLMQPQTVTAKQEGNDKSHKKWRAPLRDS